VLVFIISNAFMLSSPEALDLEQLITIQVKADIVHEDVVSPIAMPDDSQSQKQHPTHLDQFGGLKDMTRVEKSDTDGSMEEIKTRTPGAVVDAKKDQLTLDAHSTNRLVNANSVQSGSNASSHEESPEGGENGRKRLSFNLWRTSCQISSCIIAHMATRLLCMAS
jgi:hypothetical protein